MRVDHPNNVNSSDVISKERENSLERERAGLIQIKERLQLVSLQDFSGSENQRAFLESKFKEIEDVLDELNRCLKFTNSLEQSSQSEEIAELTDRFIQTKARVHKSQTLHQRRVKQIQSEMEHINIANLKMSKEINEIDQQLRMNTQPLTPNTRPANQEKDSWCPDCCIIS